MDKQEIQNLIQDGIKDYMTKAQYSVTKIPSHVHNGTDSNRISQSDVVPGIKYNFGFTEDTSETITIKNIQNPTRISFFGFSANNADASPATKRAILNGEVNFGKVHTFSVANTVLTPTANAPVPFGQSANGMYVDSTSLANNRVSTSRAHFAYVTDSSGTVVSSLSLDSYINNTLTITAVVDTNWKIQGILSIT